MRVWIDETVEISDELLWYVEDRRLEEEQFKQVLGDVFRGRLIERLGYYPAHAMAELQLYRQDTYRFTKKFTLRGWIETQEELDEQEAPLRRMQHQDQDDVLPQHLLGSVPQALEAH